MSEIKEDLEEARRLLLVLVDKRPNWDGDKTTFVGLVRAIVAFDDFDLETVREIGANRRLLECENAALRAALSLARVAVNFADEVVDGRAKNRDSALATAVEASTAAAETMRAAVDLWSDDTLEDREILRRRGVKR